MDNFYINMDKWAPTNDEIIKIALYLLTQRKEKIINVLINKNNPELIILNPSMLKNKNYLNYKYVSGNRIVNINFGKCN